MHFAILATIGLKIVNDYGLYRTNRKAKESKPVFPLSQPGAYRLELRKEGKGKMC